MPQDAVEANMSSSILLITGWVLMVASTALLLKYRLLLRHYDHQLLKWGADDHGPFRVILQHRTTLIDRWGVSLTVGLVLYTVLFLVYLLYQSLERIAESLFRLLSYL
jgi:hypothetical protein